MARTLRDLLIQRQVKRVQKVMRSTAPLTQEQMIEIIQNLQCSICMEIMVYPNTNTCGHTFCYECFEKVEICPLCRQQIAAPHQFIPNMEMMQFITFYINERLPQIQEEYQARIAKFNERKQNRFYPFDQLFPGLRVDFRVLWKGRLIWLQGQIIQIRQRAGEKVIRVQSLYHPGLMRDYDIKALTIARFRQFTLNSQEDIERTAVLQARQDQENEAMLQNARLRGSMQQVLRAAERIRETKEERARLNGELI